MKITHTYDIVSSKNIPLYPNTENNYNFVIKKVYCEGDKTSYSNSMYKIVNFLQGESYIKPT